MKKPLPFICALTLLLLFSCSNNDIMEEPTDDINNGNNMPEIPTSFDVDIDNDGNADYRMAYSLGYILTPHADLRITGEFNPFGDNEVLQHKEEKNLFLRNQNDIQENVSEPLFWNNIGFTEDIISILNNIEGEWPDKWEAHTDEKFHDTYFLGLKLISNTSTQLGWIELKLDTETGEVTVVDKGIL